MLELLKFTCQVITNLYKCNDTYLILKISLLDN